MKRMTAVALLAVAACSLLAEPARENPKELKVLMIGNSFSICVLSEMPQIAKSMGYKLDLTSLYIGGCSLERHWTNVCAPETAPYHVSWNTDGVKGEKQGNIPQLLTEKKWDIVTIQQASHDSWQPSTYHPWGDRLVKKIRELAPQAEIVVQETWSYTPWDRRLEKFGLNRDTMYSTLRAAYADFAKKHRLRVIPTGTAVQEYRKRLPVVYTEKSFGGDVAGSAKFEQDQNGKWTPKGDVFHLNADGYYLQGLVWTAKLFGADVTKCAYRPAHLSEEKAKLMRECAMSAVASR